MLNTNLNENLLISIRSQSSSTLKQPTKSFYQRLNIRPSISFKQTHNQTEFGRETDKNIPTHTEKCAKAIELNHKPSLYYRVASQIANCTNNFKELNSKKMSELIQSIKKTLKIYKNMENDQTIANRNINSWFHELQSAFLIPVDRQAKLQSIQHPCKIHITQNLTNSLQKQNYSTLFAKQSKIINKGNPVEVEVEKLLQQLQCQKKINSQMLSIINQTRQYFEQYKKKYTNSQRNCQALKNQFGLYMAEIDQILEKINSKPIKQATTSLQRSVRQLLIKIKFKIYDATIKSQW